MLKLITVKLLKEEIENDFWNLLYLLPFEKQKSIQKSYSLLRKKESLLAWLTSIKTISQIIKIPESNLIFDFNEHGKPYVRAHPEIQFNISHSKDMFTCVFSDKPVGVDIQLYVDDYKKILEYVMTDTEKAQIQVNKNPVRQLTRFWVRKEAYSKYIGNGLYTEFSKIEITDKNFPLFSDIDLNQYCLSVCSHFILDKTNIVFLTENDFKSIYFAHGGGNCRWLAR